DGIRAFHVTGVQTCALPISYRTAVVDIHHAAGGIVGDDCKARLGQNFASGRPCRDARHKNRLIIAGADVPRLLNAFLPSPFVPAIGWHDDAACEERAPEW